MRDGKGLSYMCLGIAWMNALDRLKAKNLIRYDKKRFGYVTTK